MTEFTPRDYGNFSRNDLRSLLVASKSTGTITREIFADLFPGGWEHDEARETAARFASEIGRHVRLSDDGKSIEFPRLPDEGESALVSPASVS